MTKWKVNGDDGLLMKRIKQEYKGLKDLGGVKDNELETRLVQEKNSAVKLDLGCGKNCTPSYIGIDKYPNEGVDFVLDIENQPLPFDNNSVDYILSRNCFEHLSSIESIMKEVYRVLKPETGVINIVVPYYKNSSAISPRHKLYFNWHSFDNYCREETRNLEGLENSFELVKRELLFENNYLFGFVSWLSKKNYYVYERFFSGLFPARNIMFILEKKVIK